MIMSRKEMKLQVGQTNVLRVEKILDAASFCHFLKKNFIIYLGCFPQFGG